MYPVSSAFSNAIRQPVIHYIVYGTIGGEVFDNSNIVAGSFHITNQCTGTSDVMLGSVFTGTLTATFRGINISRYSWVGKKVIPFFSLNMGSTWEDVPLGVYTIKEAKHSAEGVEITAYDNMIKLDKKFKASKFKTPQKMYQHLTTICTACGLTLGMTEQEIQALPNGNTNLGIVGTKSNKYLSYKKYSNDIDTYRDLVFWIAQSMGTFATINRDGELVFRKYKKTTQAVDEITESYRLAGAVFDDFTTNYTGIYVTNTKDGDEVYYGYDVTELQTEINEVSAEMTQIASQQETLWQEYQQGQITEEEYKAAMKPLNKSLKNLQKRMNWLTQALEKAQDEEDGLFMDLGENPILQPDGIGSTYAAMRQRVLKALDAISYTPFSCSTVVGVHYDLGDVIQFTGGHATEIGESCCMMAYDFNLNGEFHMQGFGSDPSKPVIKNKNSKKADKADKNGVSAPNVSTGANLPESGNDGDLFIQTGGNISDEVLQMEYSRTDSTSSHPISINNFSGDNDSGFNFIVNGNPGSHDGERIYFDLQGLEEGGQYHVEFDAQLTRADGGWEPGQWNDTMKFGNTTINGIKDFNEHHYSTDFTYSSANKDLYFYYSLRDNYNFTYEYRNMVFTSGNTEANSVSYYSETNNQWNNIDFVKKIVDVLSGGKKIGTAKNSDGTDTDIYVPNMSGASASAAGSNGLVPAPASGDEGKFLRGDGTWQNAGGGGSDLELEIDNGEIVATYGAQTEETEPILKDSTGDDIVTMLEAIATEMGALASPEIYAPVVYSTEEREIGVWTDGKPLYQRTYKIAGGIACNSNTWVNTGITTPSNVEQVVRSIASANSACNANIIASCDNSTIYIMNLRNSSVTIVDFTIQYTKTTDIAGSGNYAALGVPAVHYSTNEHVVGTWIDGSTLYECTYTGLSTNTNGINWVTVNGITIQNLGEIISCDTYRVSGSGILTKMAIAEFSKNTNNGLQVSVVSSSFDGTINTVTIRYTKTS